MSAVDYVYKCGIAAATDFSPAAAPMVVSRDFRPRIFLPGGGRLLDDFSIELARLLHPKNIFNRAGMVMVLDEQKNKLINITANTFRSWIENERYGGVVCQSWVGHADKQRVEDRTLTKQTAEGVLASPAFLNGLRQISRINTVRQPVLREDGTLELLEVGYDEPTQIYTVDTVDYDENMSMEDAYSVLEKWFAGAAFHPNDKYRSLAVAHAMLLATFCDCMLSRFVVRPAFIVTANSEGAGKTTMATLALAPVFGPVKLTPPPSKEGSDKLAELLSSIVQSAAPYVVFDNWAGQISSPALAAFITANSVAGRILGTSYMFEAEKQCLVFITANKANADAEMRRRALFIQLYVEEARAEDRPIARPINEGDILAGRGEILAALWAYVRNWGDNGRVPGSVRHASFEEWGKMIGGIVEAAGLPSPLLPPPIAVDQRYNSFERIIVSVASGMMTNELFLPPSDLLEVARKVGAFPWFISDDAEQLTDKDLRGERTAFARQCEHFKGRKFRITLSDQRVEVAFDSLGEGHSRQYRFRKA